MATCPARTSCVPRGSLSSIIVQDLLNIGVDTAQVAPLHRSIDVDHGLIVIVRDQGGFYIDVHLSQVAEQFRRFRGLRRDGDIIQRLHGIDLVLRNLHGHVVLETILRIHPKGRIDLEARTQRKQHAIGYVVLAEADVEGAGPVDIQKERGIGKQLLHVNVHGSGNMLNAIGDLLRDLIVAATGLGR